MLFDGRQMEQTQLEVSTRYQLMRTDAFNNANVRWVLNVKLIVHTFKNICVGT